mgnify:FL=1
MAWLRRRRLRRRRVGPIVAFLLGVVTVAVSGSYQRGLTARWPLNVIVMPAAYPDVLAAIEDHVALDEGLLQLRGLAFGTSTDDPSFFISRTPGASTEVLPLYRFMQSCAFLCYVYTDAVKGWTIRDAMPPLAASQAAIPTHYAIEMDAPGGSDPHNCSCLTNDGSDRSTWSGIPASSRYGLGYNVQNLDTHGVATLYTQPYTDGAVPLTDCSSEGTLWAPAPWATISYPLSFSERSRYSFGRIYYARWTGTDVTMWRWYNRTVISGVGLAAPLDSILPTPPDAPPGTRLEWSDWTLSSFVPGACICFLGFTGHTCSEEFHECFPSKILPGGVDALGWKYNWMFVLGPKGVVGGDPPAMSAEEYNGFTEWSKLSVAQASGLRCGYGGCKNARGGARCQFEPCGPAPDKWNVSWCGVGVCAPESGRCLCPVGWDPASDCTRCRPPFYADGNGRCVTWRGVCVDPDGDKLGNVVRGATRPPECSGHGTCSLRFGVTVVPGAPPPTHSAACVCADGWVGRFCQQPSSDTGDGCGLAGTRQCRGLLQRDSSVAINVNGCDRRLVTIPVDLSWGSFLEAVELCAALDGVVASSVDLAVHAPWGAAYGFTRMVDDDGSITATRNVPHYVLRFRGIDPVEDPHSLLHFQGIDARDNIRYAPLYAHCMVSPCGDVSVEVSVTSITAVVRVEVPEDVSGLDDIRAAVAAAAPAVCAAAIPGGAATSVPVRYTVGAAIVWDSQRRRVPASYAVGVPVDDPDAWISRGGGLRPISSLVDGSVDSRWWTYAEAYEESYGDVWMRHFRGRKTPVELVHTFVPGAADFIVVGKDGDVSEFGAGGVQVPHSSPAFMSSNLFPGIVMVPGTIWTTCAVPPMSLQDLFRVAGEDAGRVSYAPHAAVATSRV